MATVPLAIDISEPNSSSFNTTILEPSGLVAQWLQCRTSHSKVAGSNPTDVRVMILRSPGVVNSEKLHLTLCTTRVQILTIIALKHKKSI